MWASYEMLKDSGTFEKMKQDPETIKLKEEFGFPERDYPAPVIGKWHYQYTSNDGSKYISLVELLECMMPWRKGGSEWEICSAGTCSNCADAEERFDSQAEAEVRIKELFGEQEIIREYLPRLVDKS